MAEPPAVSRNSTRHPPRRNDTQQTRTSVGTSQRGGASRRQRPQRITPAGDRPQYSLAGSFAGPPNTGGYVDPQYYDLNPRYQRQEAAPLWGLAKPLPRIVRPGMRGKQEDKPAERPAPGSSEAIPQLGMIDEQRDNVGKETNDNGPRNGYGNQNRRSSGKGAQEIPKTPGLERGNPMEEWLSYPSTKSSTSNPLDQAGDIGTGGLPRLSNVDEHPIEEERTRRDNFAQAHNEHQYDVDLEAGQKYDDFGDEQEEDDERADSEYYEQDELNAWASIRAKLREPLAECLATMIAITIGLCTNLAVQTSSNTFGDYQSTNWSWGLGITIGIYVAGGISGGHLNPAISIALCLYRGFPVRKTLTYIAAQVIGGVLAGLIAYGVYYDAIASFNAAGGLEAAPSAVGLFAGGSGKSFYTEPASFANPGSAFANEFVATAILACAILALGDDSNAPPGAGMHALIVGLVVTVLTMAFGYNTGACLNPARDFGPRLATAMVGYGREVFTVRQAWWIYGAWGATISGALVGGLLYDIAIFIGGESPVNYPRGKRKKVEREAKENAKRRWWYFRWGVEKGLKGEFGKDG
ncbi:MIP family channel protein [Phlyctema vagabunda]|uniref:MIP family channel protein n=1 Tax=Phlyctema vagabunda TaxID=108571 RepID=A0ABR4P3E2_9HELO